MLRQERFFSLVSVKSGLGNPLAVTGRPGHMRQARLARRRCRTANKLALAMRATFAYTAARILLFAAVLGVLYLVGARGCCSWALAVLISGIISFVVLSRQRDAMSGSITPGSATSTSGSTRVPGRKTTTDPVDARPGQPDEALAAGPATAPVTATRRR